MVAELTLDEVTLRDGTPAMVWPLLPEDREGLRLAYEQLSPDAKYHRFLSDVRSLSEGLLRILVDGVDGVDHVALVLVALPPDGRDAVAGVARMIRYADRPDTADVAVTVGDAWRSRGVASALLTELARRRPVGVTRVVTYVAADNAPSLAMLARLGSLRITGIESGVYEVTVELAPVADGQVERELVRSAPAG